MKRKFPFSLKDLQKYEELLKICALVVPLQVTRKLV